MCMSINTYNVSCKFCHDKHKREIIESNLQQNVFSHMRVGPEEGGQINANVSRNLNKKPSLSSSNPATVI